jgi:hypothetical protein
MCLDHDLGHGLACLPFGYTDFLCGRKSSHSFLAGVAQNSFPNFSEARNLSESMLLTCLGQLCCLMSL